MLFDPWGISKRHTIFPALSAMRAGMFFENDQIVILISSRALSLIETINWRIYIAPDGASDAGLGLGVDGSRTKMKTK